MELDMGQDEILKPIIHRNLAIHKNQICIFYIIRRKKRKEKKKLRGRMRVLFFMSFFFMFFRGGCPEIPIGKRSYKYINFTLMFLQIL